MCRKNYLNGKNRKFLKIDQSSPLYPPSSSSTATLQITVHLFLQEHLQLSGGNRRWKQRHPLCDSLSFQLCCICLINYDDLFFIRRYGSDFRSDRVFHVSLDRFSGDYIVNHSELPALCKRIPLASGHTSMSISLISFILLKRASALFLSSVCHPA